MYLKAGDAISGKEGKLIAVINGKKIEVAECKSVTAKIAKQKKEFKALGYRGTQQKATGWSGTGTMSIYFVTSYWSQLMLDYVNEGKDTYFTLQIINEDPTSSIGRQVVTLTDVNLDEDEIAKLDVDSDFLEKQTNFTFSGVDIPETFTELK